jgi:hypothetical protein
MLVLPFFHRFPPASLMALKFSKGKVKTLTTLNALLKKTPRFWICQVEG